MKKEKFQESLEVQQERIIFKFGVRISCKTSRGIYQFFFSLYMQLKTNCQIKINISPVSLHMCPIIIDSFYLTDLFYYIMYSHYLHDQRTQLKVVQTILINLCLLSEKKIYILKSIILISFYIISYEKDLCYKLSAYLIMTIVVVLHIKYFNLNIIQT